jgi:hypothetical protein
MGRKRKRPRDKHLEVKLAGGVLTISIGVEALKWAAEHNEEFYKPETGKYALVISDADEFAKDIVTALRDEQEDGTTTVHELIDKAVRYVMENGSEGLDEDAIEAIEEAERAELSENAP